MKKIKNGGAGTCFVFICNICNDQITSVRAAGGHESEEIGDNIHICSHCCVHPETLTTKDAAKATTYINIYNALGHPVDITSKSYWPCTADGVKMSLGEVFSIASTA